MMLFDSENICNAGHYRKDCSPLRSVIDTIAPVFEENHPELINVLCNAESLFKKNKANSENAYHNISRQALVLAYAFHMFEMDAAPRFYNGVYDKEYRKALRIPELMVACCITDYDYGSERNRHTSKNGNITQTEEENSFLAFIEDYKKAYGCLSDFEEADLDLNLIKSLVIITRTSRQFFGFGCMQRKTFRDIMREDEFIIKLDMDQFDYELPADDMAKYIQDVCTTPRSGCPTFAAKAISDADLAPLFYMGIDSYNVHTILLAKEKDEDLPSSREQIDYIDEVVGLPLLGTLDPDSLISLGSIKKYLKENP